jgi:hypothetical protein
MKPTLEKLIGREVSVRTVDGANTIVTVLETNSDSFLAETSEGTKTLVPYSAVAMLSFK